MALIHLIVFLQHVLLVMVFDALFKRVIGLFVRASEFEPGQHVFGRGVAKNRIFTYLLSQPMKSGESLQAMALWKPSRLNLSHQHQFMTSQLLLAKKD